MNKNKIRIRTYLLLIILIIVVSILVPLLLETGTEMFVERITSYTERQVETETVHEEEDGTDVVLDIK